jgi:hypothetical protein
MDEQERPLGVDEIAALCRRAVERAPAEDVLERAGAVQQVIRGLDRAAGLEEPSERRRAVDWLRRGLVAELDRTVLGTPAAALRAATAIELLVSINESPRRLDQDFPGVRARIDLLAERLGFDQAARRRVRRHLVFEHHGDLGMQSRRPHLHDAFFRLVLDPRAPLHDRAARLYRTLVAHLAGSVDYFLWYHLFRRHEPEDPRFVRALFGKNDAAEVDAALRALLADDQALAGMLADDDLRHSGQMKLVIGRYHGLAMEHVRRLARGATVARWIDLAGGLSTYYLDELLGVPDVPAFCFDAEPSGAESFPHVLPLQVGFHGPLRLLDPEEIAAFAARIAASRVVGKQVDLRKPADLCAAATPVDGATLYTCGGSYLGAIRPEDEELRREAQERHLSGARVETLQMAEAIFTALRPGDLIAFFGRAGIPYFRGVTWLILAVSPDGRPRLRGIGYRTGYPRRVERWELV